MGLSASMWTSVSGLLAHGNKMNVVGNNIANVSTIGFKSQRMDFSDYLYISGGSASGPVQIGAGVNTYAVIGDFSQGTLESTNSVTDLAIDGNGFFKVRQPNSEQMYYTRAGDFYFNADRQLQNPEGYRLQGWKIDHSTRLTFKSDSVNLGKALANESAFQGTGTPQDIVLDSWYLEPERTSSVNFTMGLTSDNKSDKSTSTTSPMTALFDQWDATKKPPMAESSYATSSSIKVYDEGGSAHTMTVYYDQVAAEATDGDGNTIYKIDGLPAGYTMYEYVVTIPPEEDMRSYGGEKFNPATNEFEKEPTKFYGDPEAGTNKNAGMLMTGHLIFDTAGNLVNQTAYTYAANEYPNPGNQAKSDPASMGSWQSTRFSSNGLPVFTANFTGQPLANSVSEMVDNQQSQAQDFLIELDFGLRTSGEWTYAGTLSDLRGAEGKISPIDKVVGSSVKEEVQKVNFVKGNPAANPPTGDTWKYADAPTDDIPISSRTQMLYMDADGTTYPLYMGDGGPKTVVDGGKVYFADLNGDPILNKNDKPIEVRNATVDANGKAVIDWGNVSDDLRIKREVSYIFPSELNKPHYIAGNTDAEGTITDMKEIYLTEEKNKVYYTDKNNNRYYVEYNNDGLITGISGVTDPDGNPLDYLKNEDGTYTIGKLKNGAATPPTIADFEADPKPWTTSYVGKKLHADMVTQSVTIDYNESVSTMDTPIRGENSTKAGSASFITQDAGQNGYPSGILSGTNITADGVVYGYYDNGETVPLYQIALYDFHNHQGLRREGGNLYAQTKESGEARQGVAGEAGFGNVKAYNIEGSNVDLSREFVNMITTQRGFQANSKGITTVDTMLETVIGMKR